MSKIVIKNCFGSNECTNGNCPFFQEIGIENMHCTLSGMVTNGAIINIDIEHKENVKIINIGKK